MFCYIFSQDKGQKLFNEKKYGQAQEYYKSILMNREDDKAARYSFGSSAYYQNDIDYSDDDHELNYSLVVECLKQDLNN